MTDPVTRICNEAVDALEGTGLAFAVVLWKPGREDHPAGVACQTPTAHEREAIIALATASECLKATLNARVLS
ncbi:MAG: hypothetical protein DI552_00405 [Brevundimonas sp.]|uniref:hypothetical protein n=1 Tax=Brevundimonas sp. TaxID=1871086 RepID=UPI000DBBC0BD|nr:hypothetical protein [Brevundimonas sp.]PZU62198.1 MAG: hypothetical protein DI552_00405 [Brevundimonas sp.]